MKWKHKDESWTQKNIARSNKRVENLTAWSTVVTTGTWYGEPDGRDISSSLTLGIVSCVSGQQQNNKYM